MLFVTQCAGCNQPGEALCHRCRFSLAAASSQVSETGIMAALPFEGVARQVVHGLKYRNRRSVARQVARLMVRRLRLGTVDVVTWAPTSRQRQRQRGYDQAELIARTVSQSLGCQCLPTLQRNATSGDSTGDHQTGRSRRERLAGASFAFGGSGVGTRGVDPHRLGSVLVVDDIRTTGATLSAAGDTLLEAGATSVSGLTLAVTL